MGTLYYQLELLERSFVWAGGTVFVLSLAFTAWWFAAWLGQTVPFAGWLPVLQNALLFSIFAAHHSLWARPRVKAAMARMLPERLLRSVYVWTASILLVLVCLLWRRVGGELTHVVGPAALVHSGAQLAGLLLIVLSVRAINALELAGIQLGGAAQSLQITGPDLLVRHPLYLGWMLMVFGAAHLTGDRLAFAVMSTLYLVIAVNWEERALEREFGEAYRRYRQEVRWRIVPFIY
jgi:protein-S-isoprenylcysteine O-methyltransferase Ste14